MPADRVRSSSEIAGAEQEFFDRVRYQRHLELRDGYEPDARKQADEGARQAKERRPDLRAAEDEYELGIWSGKLSALRRVLGDEWDNLET
jgi:hypothetical protein